MQPCPRTAPVESPRASAVEHNNGHVTTSPRTVTVESPRASAVLHESPQTLTLNVESAKHHANVTHLAHDPILTLTCISAPPNDRDDKVSALSENCNCGTSTVFCTVVTQAPVVVQQRASRPSPRTAPVGSRRSSEQFVLWVHVAEHNGKVHHSVDELDLGHLHVLQHNGLLELVADDHRDVHNRPTPAPLKKFRHPPTTALQSSGNDGGYSQLHQTQAPPQADVIIDLASSLCTGWSPRGRGSLSQGRRHSTDQSSEQPEGHPSSDRTRCPCRLLAGS